MRRETVVLERKLPKVFLPCPGLEGSLLSVRHLVEEMEVCRYVLSLSQRK